MLHPIADRCTIGVSCLLKTFFLLLHDVAGDANSWDIGAKEKSAVLECEARIEQMCMDALGLQQRATKMKQVCACFVHTCVYVCFRVRQGCVWMRWGCSRGPRK